MSGRETVLGAVRGALGGAAARPAAAGPGPGPGAAYRRAGTLAPEPRVAMFAERCAEYRATVTRCAGDDAAIGRCVTAVCARHAVAALAVAPGVPAAWLPDGVAVTRDGPAVGIDTLDGVDGALTGCLTAIAITGTIVLAGGERDGRRALTLVPDLHVCVVRAEDVLETVPEAMDRVGAAVRGRRAPITFVSGPSATSDIELIRVEGVHGPRRLEVVLAG